MKRIQLSPNSEGRLADILTQAVDDDLPPELLEFSGTVEVENLLIEDLTEVYQKAGLLYIKGSGTLDVTHHVWGTECPRSLSVTFECTVPSDWQLITNRFVLHSDILNRL